MSNQISLDKLFIKDIFQKWYRIPSYQRPYVWEDEQVISLLEDISSAQQFTQDSEYFLGSIINH